MKKTSSGFTLIEILIAVAIISILSSVILSSLNTARAKARDTRRLSDMHQLQVALELYYNDNGSYPDSSMCAPDWCHYCGNPNGVADALEPLITGGYLKELPQDPYPSPDPDCFTYEYMSHPGTYWGWPCYENGVYVDVGNYGYAIRFEMEVTSLSTTTWPEFAFFRNNHREYCAVGRIQG